VYARKKMVGIG